MSDGNHKIILTIDVEDNFTREELSKQADWNTYERQVVQNTDAVIKFLQEMNADATFFVLGKVAERHPEVVTLIDTAGYEVASHGYNHDLVHMMSEETFEEDVKKSLDILQTITSKKVRGFRARSFSITSRTLWALNILDKYELDYDSSILDTEMGRITGNQSAPPRKLLNHSFTEYPISTMNIIGKQVHVGGGVTFRLLPSVMLNAIMGTSISFESNRMVYCHVWEFNKNQPKRNVGLLQSLAQASWTYSTERKIRKLSLHNEFISIKKHLQSQSQR